MILGKIFWVRVNESSPNFYFQFFYLKCKINLNVHSIELMLKNIQVINYLLLNVWSYINEKYKFI